MSMTEEDTPFKANRTQTIFKNTANVSLRGTTYDAKHLDRFLGSNFGEKQIQVGEGSQMMHQSTVSARTGPGGGGGSNMMSYLMNGTSNSIKPSVAFVSMSRKEYKQNHYTDEQDGPSALQMLGNEKAQKDIHPGNDNLFECERKDHIDTLSEKTAVLDDVKKMLYTNYAEPTAEISKNLLSFPAYKRNEIKNAKSRLDEFAQFKEQHKFLGRRERVIKSGWRHGITGMDNADSENTSVFFQDKKQQKN